MGPNSRGRPLGKYKDRVKEYVCERAATRGGGVDQARRECLDRKRWKLFCCGHPLGERSQMVQDVRAIDRKIDKKLLRGALIILKFFIYVGDSAT